VGVRGCHGFSVPLRPYERPGPSERVGLARRAGVGHVVGDACGGWGGGDLARASADRGASRGRGYRRRVAPLNAPPAAGGSVARRRLEGERGRAGAGVLAVDEEATVCRGLCPRRGHCVPG